MAQAAARESANHNHGTEVIYTIGQWSSLAVRDMRIRLDDGEPGVHRASQFPDANRSPASGIPAAQCDAARSLRRVARSKRRQVPLC